jgi:hypothetical protein
VKIVNDPMEFI